MNCNVFKARRFPLLVFLLLATCLYAEPGQLSVSPRILDSLEIRYGLHTTIYNRIEPLALKAWAPAVKSPASQVVEEGAVEEPAPSVDLFGHALVGADGSSEVRLWTVRGEVVFRSGADFRLLDDWMGFESAGVWIQTRFIVEPTGSPVAAPAAKMGQVGAFEVVEGVASKEVLGAIEALHAFYAKHLTQLRHQHAERERLAADAARESAKPPQPTTTVVNFFPIRQ